MEQLIHQYGYFAVFVGTVMEGESVLLLAGLLAHLEYLSLPWVITSAFVGAITGDHFFYYLGRFRGTGFLARRPLWQKRTERVFRLLHRHQILLILSFRFLYGLRMLTPVAIGASGIPRLRFSVLNIIGASVWSVVIGLAGYFIGNSLQFMLGELHRYQYPIIAAVIAGAVLIWLVIHRRERDAEDAEQEQGILDAWRDNARPWAKAVREGAIGSRERVTNAAIVEAVLARTPETVLDVGCGEGWLARALGDHGIRVIGVDAVEELVELARVSGGDFRVATFDEVATGCVGEKVDVVVCNFSLLGREPVENLFYAMPALLNSGGAFIIQTLHPAVIGGEDGWRSAPWDGIPGEFGEPAPWYFRTLESWRQLFRDAGLRLIGEVEPRDRDTGTGVSIIFIAEVVG